MKESEKFEIEVRKLLSMRGWTVENEKVVGHKKVDALITKTDEFGGISKFAIECKFYKKKLSQADVTLIYANYLPLLQNRLVSGILLVTENGLHPSAETFINIASNFRHSTRSIIQDNILDFTSYTSALIQWYETDNISKYYVPQRPQNIDDFYSDYIQKYIDEPDRFPLAILGGYGTGKSCLAKFLAAHLSKAYLKDHSKRIPIHIDLSSMTNDQSLEGLLGKQFTSKNIIRNYNFHLFMALNEMGKFIFILDGFDEMKRMMSWDSLKFNLSQLNMLITKNSKLILLGRPTAFLDENEQKEALHGIQVTRSGDERRVRGWPEFEELYLRAFSTQDMVEFINRYSRTLSAEKDYEIEKKRVFGGFIKTVQHGEGTLIDIISRPVQLKMLMEILPSFDGNLKLLTVSELYSEFIDLVAEREEKKKARTKFPSSTRRRFMAKLAFYMWQNQRMREITSHEFPISLISSFCNIDDDPDTLRRDLIVGSILERKGDKGFFFAHRSFQEFLIAEELYNMFESKDLKLLKVYDLPLEIREFFIDIIGRKSGIEFKKWIILHLGTDRRNATKKISKDLAIMISELCLHYNISSPVILEALPNNKRSKKKSSSDDDIHQNVGILSISKKADMLITEKKKHVSSKKEGRKLVKRDFSKR